MAAEAKGGGTGAVVSFAMPSSLGKNNRVNKVNTKSWTRQQKLLRQRGKTYESDPRKSYRDAGGFLEID
jgi:hypothetical protein